MNEIGCEKCILMMMQFPFSCCMQKRKEKKKNKWEREFACLSEWKVGEKWHFEAERENGCADGWGVGKGASERMHLIIQRIFISHFYSL